MQTCAEMAVQELGMRGEPAPFDSSHCLYASQLQYRWMTLLLRIRRRASVGVSATLWADIPNFFHYRAGLFTMWYPLEPWQLYSSQRDTEGCASPTALLSSLGLPAADQP
jgi:hypothetical protein